jgi:hypothetical protein
VSHDDIRDWALYSLMRDTERMKKEKKMNEDQMEQVWRCKDGKGGVFTGSKEEVEAYLKSKNPLRKMQFPYKAVGGDLEPEDSSWERTAIVAFANLAPLIQELHKNWEKEWEPAGNWRKDMMMSRWQDNLRTLLLAYEEALKQVPQ